MFTYYCLRKKLLLFYRSIESGILRAAEFKTFPTIYNYFDNCPVMQFNTPDRQLGTLKALQYSYYFLV